ncbi:NAD-dependent malic enzyme [Streptomyces turgidiscabies]|uniref:Malolactic enzyme n=1 Tax=Streptomyces turgidiscabies (strain Car8) TaxID=698760 RepID=L7F7G4_STRT8|nr:MULTISPECIES: NAD-dependent malic enzyme [Streptomyces]ELP67182.1 malic enzyme, NAD binding domain protein [Streptomyces turgidiscabies Car8]MDX3491125.1 NAD-dependent malic enzyme [Streptomyces turgidiscabies]GAQ72976.1 NAD-dependent malic enzyme [Streptomyces turgidiscabies]
MTANESLAGTSLLADPLRNKGTAFSPQERAEHGLDGLLPAAVETLDEQADRAYEAFLGYDKPLNRHIYLRQLQDTNEILFHHLVTGHLEEMLPVVYTPTVGEACRRFSEIYRRPRGLFLSYGDRHRFRELLRNRPHPDVDVIVVTDGERILGLGDQGVGGMGIPIGKLSLYTAIGGIHPARTLPILLDAGTDNEQLLADPHYLGRRERRVTGAAYEELVESLVSAVEAELPGTLLQWEDFATAHARPILTRYQDRLLTFNDDIQGTAAVALGALTTATTVAGTHLTDQRIVILGAGSAAVGVADMIRTAMTDEGLSPDEARSRFWFVDVDGLLVTSREGLSEEQRVYARDDYAHDDEGEGEGEQLGLAEVVRRVEPTVLIGLSTAKGAFTEEIVRQMASTCERPVIFPLSNPTSHSEADPADLARWTDGKVLVATGSPFPPLKIDGREVPVAQANNVYVFPAIGLAVTAARATRVTDPMMVAAARAVGRRAARSAPDDVAAAPLLPPLRDMRDAAREIAVAAATAAVEDGVAPHATEEDLRAAVARAQWTPRYDPTVRTMT